MSVVPMFFTNHAGLHYAPALELEQLGIRVVRTWLRDTWGAWSRERRDVIVVASGLSEVQERCVLAHELEHVLADDADCDGRLASVRQERRADLEAARKLVAISDLAEVAQWANDIHTAAAELRVTERLLEVRLTDLRGEGWPWPHQGGSKIAG
ncbi:ImmA/IrrE family metallo-endopeptidase [Streptomyces sp. ME02-8801-2C]|uniref:ImmA/IrrE family metallo-endopeptidase n=1 Tax=Streptomyces sp. ME02-8801-2C TaxID=3028680 RepID=UPI0029BAA184|nr:ImmA/IrrE family metallo-endopeptidase [Streptomyces sp. ME02-8801-2C]MDX3455102.1 ImmA/IrrE family metallo-endopeptidase [Streptomyces sp. ME02-8801-2C]